MNCLIFIVLCGLFSGVLSSDWEYGEETHWPEICQTGKAQSPIKLDESTSIKKQSFEKFLFSNYHTYYPAVITNNGHTVKLNVDPGRQPPKMGGGGLEKEYVLDHLHFHWDSEHTINGFRYPLEAHLVHYAVNYDNISNALKHKDGVAVLGVFFDESPDDDDTFGPILKVIKDVADEINHNEQAEKLEVYSFLPRDKAGFFRYNGSLTTPDCTESVIWTVFTNTLPISKKQLEAFQVVHSKSGILKKNYRSLQPLNDRKVYQKVSPKHLHAAPGGCGKPFILSLLILVFPLILRM